MRIKNKQMLELTTSFTQETTSWICGRPSASHFECSVKREMLGVKRSKEIKTMQSESTSKLQLMKACRDVEV